MIDGEMRSPHSGSTLFELNVKTGAGEVGVKSAMELDQDLVPASRGFIDCRLIGRMIDRQND